MVTDMTLGRPETGVSTVTSSRLSSKSTTSASSDSFSFEGSPESVESSSSRLFCCDDPTPLYRSVFLPKSKEYVLQEKLLVDDPLLAAAEVLNLFNNIPNRDRLQPREEFGIARREARAIREFGPCQQGVAEQRLQEEQEASGIGADAGGGGHREQLSRQEPREPRAPFGQALADAFGEQPARGQRRARGETQQVAGLLRICAGPDKPFERLAAIRHATLDNGHAAEDGRRHRIPTAADQQETGIARRLLENLEQGVGGVDVERRRRDDDGDPRPAAGAVRGQPLDEQA